MDINDDNGLCRFEYFECIVRIAKTKIYDKGYTSTMSEAVEKLIVNSILPNSLEQMEWQKFRDDQLYCLDVDDLLKKNSVGIETVYRKGALKPGQKVRKVFKIDDAL